MPKENQCEEVGAVVMTRDAFGDAYEQRLTAAEQRLTAAERLAAYTAHEVRNPLAALRAMAQLMLGTADRRLRDTMMHQIVTCIDDLDGFLQQLLGLAHADATRFGPVDVTDVIDNVVQLFTAHADQVGADVHVRVARTLPPVLGNADLLRHVFMNLLKNALEAMPKGGPVAITVRHYSRLNAVRVGVRDWGPGIPPQYHHRLFTDMSASTRDAAGGIGLPFAHHIVTGIHGGRLWFRTKSGVGTVFYVELRCAAEQAETGAAVAAGERAM